MGDGKQNDPGSCISYSSEIGRAEARMLELKSAKERQKSRKRFCHKALNTFCRRYAFSLGDFQEKHGS